jgi:hypothetical protein
MRLSIGAAALLTVVGTLALSPLGADAKPVHYQLVEGLGVEQDMSMCTFKGDLTPRTPSVPADGTMITRTTSGKGIFTGTDSSDTTKLSGTSTQATSVKVTSTDMHASLRLRTQLEATAAHPKSTDCEVGIYAVNLVNVHIDLKRPGWIASSTTASGHGAALTLFGIDQPSGSDVQSLGAGQTLHESAYVTKGSHKVTLGIEAAAAATGELGGLSVSRTAHVTGSGTLDYFKLGQAAAKPSGPGTSYVSLPGSLSCSQQALTARLTKRAADAKSVTILVNGQKAASTTKTKAGEKLTAKDLVITPTTQVEAVTSFAGKTVTARRTYYGCS